MFLVAVGTVIAVVFQRAVRKRDVQPAGGPLKALAVVTFLIWACIIVLGRLIAYDHVWGSWSPAPRS
jgi:MFS-type transporter involved in bile tolerance (Atg22 family)